MGGRQFISNRIPGYRMASILALPNFGQEASYQLRLPPNEGSIGSNYSGILEAFWQEARVVSTDVGAGDQLLLTYKGPTRRYKDVPQSVRLTPVATEGWSLDEDHYISSQVLVQDNLDQNLRGLYQVVTLYERQMDDAGGVRALQRIAAYEQDDSEPMYFDADGYAAHLRLQARNDKGSVSCVL